MPAKKGTKLAKYQQRIRVKAKQAAEKQQHSLVAIALAFGVGFAKNRGVSLPTVAGIHPAALYGVAAMVISYFIKDKQIKKIAEASADGLLSVGAYVAGRDGFKQVFGDYVEGWGQEIIEEDYY